MIHLDGLQKLSLWMTTAPLGNIPIYTLIIKEDNTYTSLDYRF